MRFATIFESDAVNLLLQMVANANEDLLTAMLSVVKQANKLACDRRNARSGSDFTFAAR